MNTRFLIDEGDLVLIPKFQKHLAGRHNQKTHGGGMGPNWQKGEWHEMSDKDYVSFISESNRLEQKRPRKELYLRRNGIGITP